MSRKYNIRWSQADEKELRRVVKNYNAKLSRLAKKSPDIKSALPEKVSAAQMRDMIETRQDLNRELNALRRFSQKGAEELVDVPDNDYNLKITKWQKEEINRRVAVINRTRKQRLKKLQETEATQGGKGLGYSAAPMMGKADQLSLSPIKGFTRYMNRADLRKRYAQLLKESKTGFWSARDEQTRQNYIKGLYDNFSSFDVEDIVKTIEGMDIDEFRKKFDSDQGKFETMYPNDNDEYIAALEQLKSLWMPADGQGIPEYQDPFGDLI